MLSPSAKLDSSSNLNVKCNLVSVFLISLFLFVDENENYVDDWCLGHLLQGMCYRCVNKPKEAMESLLNAVNRSVFFGLLRTRNFVPHFRSRFRENWENKSTACWVVFI